MRPLDLDRLFDRDDLAEARKAQLERRKAWKDAEARRDSRDKHTTYAAYRDATCVVVRLELRRGR